MKIAHYSAQNELFFPWFRVPLTQYFYWFWRFMMMIRQSSLFQCIGVVIGTCWFLSLVRAGDDCTVIQDDAQQCQCVADQLNLLYTSRKGVKNCVDLADDKPSFLCSGIFFTLRGSKTSGISKSNPQYCALLPEQQADGDDMTDQHTLSWCPSGKYSGTTGEIGLGKWNLSYVRSDFANSQHALYEGDGSNGLIIDGAMMENRWIGACPNDCANGTGTNGCGAWSQGQESSDAAKASGLDMGGPDERRQCYEPGDMRDGKYDTANLRFADDVKAKGYTTIMSATGCDQTSSQYYLGFKTDPATSQRFQPNVDNKSCSVMPAHFDDQFIGSYGKISSPTGLQEYNEIIMQEHSGVQHWDFPVLAFFQYTFNGSKRIDTEWNNLLQQKYCYERLSGGRKVAVVIMNLDEMEKGDDGQPFSCDSTATSTDEISPTSWTAKLDKACDIPGVDWTKIKTYDPSLVTTTTGTNTGTGATSTTTYSGETTTSTLSTTGTGSGSGDTNENGWCHCSTTTWIVVAIVLGILGLLCLLGTMFFLVKCMQKKQRTRQQQLSTLRVDPYHSQQQHTQDPVAPNDFHDTRMFEESDSGVGGMMRLRSGQNASSDYCSYSDEGDIHEPYLVPVDGYHD